MSKLKLMKELKKLNEKIDRRIIDKKPYAKEAREHRAIVALLK